MSYITAGVVGIQAEIAQNKIRLIQQEDPTAKQSMVWIFECRNPNQHAFKLGLAAVVLLSLSHFIANLLAGCVVISSKQEMDKASPNKQLAFISHVLLWIVGGIAFILLVSGTLANSKGRRHDCGMVHRKQLSAGGILCLIHGLFAVAYYVSAATVIREQRELNLQGVLT